MFDNGKQNQQFAGGPVVRVHLLAGGSAGSQCRTGIVRIRRIGNLAVAGFGNQYLSDLGVDAGAANHAPGSIVQTDENQGRKSNELSIVEHHEGGSRPCRPFFNIG